MNSDIQKKEGKRVKEVTDSNSPENSEIKDGEAHPIEALEEILTRLGISEKDLPEVKKIKGSLHYEGIFPPPWIIKGYEELLPGAADRILKLTENNAAHRISRSNKGLDVESRNSLLGLIFGFVIAISFFVGSVYLIATGKEISGTIIGTLDLVSLVSVFVIGSKLRKEERKKNLNLMLRELLESRDAPE